MQSKIYILEESLDYQGFGKLSDVHFKLTLIQLVIQFLR